MNSFSWLIYLSYVAGNISVFAVVCAMVLGVTALYFYISSNEYDDTLKRKKNGHIFASITLFLSFFSVLIPSRDVIMLIAGSEYLEEVAKTPDGMEFINDGTGLAKDTVKLLREYVTENLNKVKEGD